ncbi:MAG: helix-turn-helix transcriptional regulator [Acetobacteraceae bacterium]|jgi:predicted XRE-type DNA-binding protein
MSEVPATKYYFRQRQQNRLYDVVIRAIEEDHIRRKEIAEKLGIPPSQVTRLLSGPANWTSDTISDLLFSIEAELDFHVVRFRDRVKGNRFHPVGENKTTLANAVQVTTTTTASVITTIIPLPGSQWPPPVQLPIVTDV